MAFKENIEEKDQRELLSDGWYEYFGFRIPKEDIYCEGCKSSESSDADLIDKECSVRPCVIEKEIENCSECDRYICEKLEKRIVIFKEVSREVGEKIPAEDRELFIEPYENEERLEKMRENDVRD